MRIFSIAFAALALAGCATTQTRYVETYCVTKAQLAELKAAKPAKVHDQLNGQADHDIKPVTGGLVRMQAYADGLMVVLGGCVDPQS